MEWWVILGLAGWVWWQAQRIGELSRRLGELERRPGAQAPPPFAAARPEPARAPPVEREPLLLDTPLPPDEDVLVLDTPLPAASNDDVPAQHAVGSHDDTDDDAPLPPIPEAARPAARASANPERKLEQWLAENGLAWLGGGALALGAILMVSFAAQQAWFTPQVRLASAAALGLLLLAASEWVLRRPASHRLVAALLAAAGVAAFYATAWGAHALYGFVDWIAAAALLTACALLLVGLSFRHGQPLGVLALLAALFTPSFTSLADWAPEALTLFLGAVGAAGFLLAALQRWAWVAATTLAGLYFWFAAAIGADDLRRALALLSFASLGGVAVAFRRPLEGEANTTLTWRHAHGLSPAIAICVSSVAMIMVWLSTAPALSGLVAGPAWVGAMFVALAAAAVRARVAPALVVAVATASLVAGFIAYLRARFTFGPLGADFYPFILFAAIIVVISAIGAKPHRRDRAMIAGAGAVGAALLSALAASSSVDWHGPAAWAPLFVGAAILFAAAWIAARDAQDPTASSAVDFWAGAGAALLLLGVESLFPSLVRTAGHASIAITLAAGFAWRGWRALRWGALAGAALTLAHALTGSLVNTTLTGVTPLWQALLVLGLAAGFLFCAAFIVARRAPRAMSDEALSSAAIVTVLIAAFLTLRWFAIGGAGAPLDEFSEAALRTLTLLVAGHAVLPRPGQEMGRIGGLRGHVLMAAGFLYALLMPGLIFNPWWGSAPAAIFGPPLIGPLMLAFAAPGALFAFASSRLYGRQRNAARLYASAGGVFALMWALLELRRAFHGEAPSNTPIGVLEGACYALLALIAALGVAIGARLRAPAGGPFGRDLGHVMRVCAWGSVAVAGLIMLAARHPWWGGQIGGDSDTLTIGLGVLAQAFAVALALGLGRALSVARGADAARFAAAAAAALLAWSFGHAATRWLYHGGGADDGGALIGLEGFAHALWPLAFVLAASAITERIPGRDTVRSYLYDLQAIWSAAVWPALLFAALGLWLLFNPWWGDTPAQMESGPDAALAIALLGAAAWLSAMAPHVTHVRYRDWLTRIAQIAAVTHLFVAATLTVRAAFNDGAIMPGLAAMGVEMWTYSAVWALFGAAVLGVGVWRDNAVLRWCGLAILLATTAKVFLFDMAQLSGVIRVASFLGLGAVLVATALAMRRFRVGPSPQDLLTVIPGGQRETPHGPR